MWTQFGEGLAGFRVDLANRRFYFDAASDPVNELERFYAEYLAATEGRVSEAFRISVEFGLGIHLLLDRLRIAGRKWPFIKVQVTGPLSFGMTVTDQGGKPVFYHPELRDVAVKGMGLKAMWLAAQFQPLAEKVIVFFDEPSLSAYGSSAFMGVSKSDVIDSLNEVISMASECGAIPGVHCCGNTDWGLLMETDAAIVNFDAVDFMQSMAIYAHQLTGFLSRGGVLAWGAVPNTERVEKETVDDVVTRLQASVDILHRAGVDKELLTRKMIATPACGCAGLSIRLAEKVYALLADLEDVGLERIAAR
jgi:hypothetical protein